MTTITERLPEEIIATTVDELAEECRRLNFEAANADAEQVRLADYHRRLHKMMDEKIEQLRRDADDMVDGLRAKIRDLELQIASHKDEITRIHNETATKVSKYNAIRRASLKFLEEIG